MISVMNNPSDNMEYEATDSDEFRLSDVMDEFDEFVTKSGNNNSSKPRVLGSENSKLKLSMREHELVRIDETHHHRVPDFDSAYARVDEGAAARMSEAFGLEAEKALSYGFEPGDMVWGKVKSHPWWPGHVFNEAFANPSVRRTKRVGHVLVAFFGDSSYGWFDPAELIPFEPHYAEKSRQTSSKSFVKAVDEALDEFCRRTALGLTCRCSNLFNFRPTSVGSYFAVDVPGYEPGAVYSVVQIKKARERFQPGNVLGFVQQLALNPMSFQKKDVDSLKKRAAVMSYRKAVFEEYDETYAQAFGQQPVRPTREELDQIAKTSFRAPLSGPMVVAEALGEKKSNSKPIKVKERLKKDKYLFKRRDEADQLGFNNLADGDNSIDVPSAHKAGVSALPPGDYVLQKRSPALSTRSELITKQEEAEAISSGDDFGRVVFGKAAKSADRCHVAAVSDLADMEANKPQINLPAAGSPLVDSVAYDSTAAPQIAVDSVAYDSTAAPQIAVVKEENIVNSRTVSVGVSKSTAFDGSSGNLDPVGSLDDFSRKKGLEVMVDSKDESVKVCGELEGLDMYNQRSSMNIDGLNQVLDQGGEGDASESLAAPVVQNGVQIPSMIPHINIEGLVKKTKSLKRPTGERNLERPFTGEKRKKKDVNFETSSEHSHKRLKIPKEEMQRKTAGRSIGIGLPSEKSQSDMQQRYSSSSSTHVSYDTLLAQQNVDLGNIEVVEVVDDMLAFAVDPFYGVELSRAATVFQVLVRFRSRFYQRSLENSPTSEVEPLEPSSDKIQPNTVTEFPSSGEVGGAGMKHARQLPRPEDPTRAGRKRNPSDRQEEISAKRHKKVNDLKLLAAERKAGGQKVPEVQREQKQMNAYPAAPAKPASLDSGRKSSEPPSRLAEPAVLVCKFPPQTSLPSSAELKARFGRFGPLDHDAMRIFWKTFTCKVVFKHKAHAQTAYNYAVRSKGLFSGANVKYQVKNIGGQAASEADDVPQQQQPRSVGGGRVGGNSSVLGARPAMTQMQQQLKSCLKKQGEEVASVSVQRESPRVKFLLEEGGDGGASSSSSMDVNSKKFQKFVPQMLPPTPPAHFPLPPPPPLIKVEPMNLSNQFNNTSASSTTAITSMSNNNMRVDVSHQMLSLLKRCNDIVTDVKCSLGYVPYHPL